MNWSAPFEALEPGQEFVSRGRTVTEADVVSFAALGIAHGMLVVALAAGLVPFDPGRVIALRRVSDATFKRPVGFGDTLRVEGRIDSLGAGSEEAGLVTFAWNVVNQEDQVVCRARVEVLWKREVPVEAEHERNAEFVPIPL
jgi:3-hydroxybutyryl-CoA dehydratase